MVLRSIKDHLISTTPLAFTLSEIVFDDLGSPIDFKLVEVNSTFTSEMEPNSKRIIGKSMKEWLLLSEEDEKRWMKNFKELTLTKDRKEFKDLLKFKNCWYHITASITQPNYLIVFFRDMTRLKKTETELEIKQKELNLSQAFSQSIFENTPDGVIIYDVVGDGTSSKDYILKNINPACLKIEGWQKDSVIGKPLKLVRPGVDEFGIVRIFQEVWKTGEVAHYPAKVYQENDEYRWFENLVFKLPTGEIVTIYSDVTEKKQMEEKLLEEKEKLKVTLQSIGDGVITTDEKGNIEILNKTAEELTGWIQNDAKGKPLIEVFNIVNEKTHIPCEDPVRKVLEHGNVVGLANHTILITRNGGERLISDSAAPIKNKEGKISGVVLVFREKENNNN